MKRALRVNALIHIGLGLLLLASVFLGFADVPLIIAAVLAVGVAAPLQFNKTLAQDEARDLAQGKIVEVRGTRYFILLVLALLLALIGTLVIDAFFSLSDVGIFVTSMGLAAILIAFVNPKYDTRELTDIDDFG